MTDPLNRNQVQRQFDRAASTYDDVAGLQRTMANQLIDWMTSEPSIKTANRIVDLGCGTGYALSQIAKRFSAPLTGVDLSTKMLSRAASLVPGADLIHGDLHALPFTDASQTCLFSNAAIQWCELDAVTAELHRVLASDGNFFVGTFLDTTLQQFTSAFQLVGLDDPVHPMSTRAEVESALAKAGLKTTNVHQQTHELEYVDVDSMFNAVRKLGASNAMRTRSRQLMNRTAYRRMRDVFDARLVDDGRLTLTFETLLIAGRRSR